GSLMHVVRPLGAYERRRPQSQDRLLLAAARRASCKDGSVAMIGQVRFMKPRTSSRREVSNQNGSNGSSSLDSSAGASSSGGHRTSRPIPSSNPDSGSQGSPNPSSHLLALQRSGFHQPDLAVIGTQPGEQVFT